MVQQFQNSHNCESCKGNNKCYEPTWCYPVYCVIQVKHIIRSDVEKYQKEGCNLWKE